MNSTSVTTKINLVCLDNKLYGPLIENYLINEFTAAYKAIIFVILTLYINVWFLPFFGIINHAVMKKTNIYIYLCSCV